MASQTLSLADLPAYLAARAQALSNIDLTPPLKVANLLLISATKQNFVNQSDPDGVPWTPLKKPRGRPRDKRKSRRKGSDQILRDTGVLMASVSGGAGSINDVTSKSLRYGTSVSYAGYQNFGTRTIPARRFLGLTPQLRQRINDAIRRYVIKLARGQTP